ncbi:MAG TPA: DUF427 domain-containing protein [Nocardioidaceae bacterium]|nr:DUF427 domain-containing protein [Nocardioidaceae bacterium]
MAVAMGEVLTGALGELRVHPVDKWVRAYAGERVVASSARPRLVWEPRRIVPSYALPRDDIDAELVPDAGPPAAERPVRLRSGGPPLLDPSTPFAAHSCPGDRLTVRADGVELTGAAFAPNDDALADYVVLDWSAFSQWREEDEVVMGHPRDPFHRIDCLRSSRHVVISSGTQVLADTRRATILLESMLPPRYYVPREDVRMNALEPSRRRSICAYKGEASYWSSTGDHAVPDVAWSYEAPLQDAVPVHDLVSFFTERLDVVVDGVDVPRPVTPWS